jgi:hypothetical protein
VGPCGVDAGVLDAGVVEARAADAGAVEAGGVAGTSASAGVEPGVAKVQVAKAAIVVAMTRRAL